MVKNGKLRISCKLTINRNLTVITVQLLQARSTKNTRLRASCRRSCLRTASRHTLSHLVDKSTSRPWTNDSSVCDVAADLSSSWRAAPRIDDMLDVRFDSSRWKPCKQRPPQTQPVFTLLVRCTCKNPVTNNNGVIFPWLGSVPGVFVFEYCLFLAD